MHHCLLLKLQYIDSNNTVIFITLEPVTLNNTTTIKGSEKLNNVIITGSNVATMCGNF